MRLYFERKPGTGTLCCVDAVAWPCSGQHLFLSMVSDYFGTPIGQYDFHFSQGNERSDGVTAEAGQAALKDRQDPQRQDRSVGKTAAAPDHCPLIVQWREPVGAISAEFEQAIRAGGADDAATFAQFAEQRAGEYRRFMAKWLERPMERRLEVEYDELIVDPRSILQDALRLWGEVDPDPVRIGRAVAGVGSFAAGTNPREGRKHEFRHNDSSLFERIREIALGKSAAPFRRHRAASSEGRFSAEGRSPLLFAPPGTAGSVGRGDDVTSRGLKGTSPNIIAPRKPASGPERPAIHSLRHEERVVFLAIRECFSPLLTATLAANFPAEEVYTRQGDDLPNMTDEGIREYRFFAGYFTKYGVDAVPGPKRVVTVLREPRERIVSLYHHWRSLAPEVVERYNMRGPRAARALLLNDFLRSGDYAITAAINNHMTRVLLGPLRIHKSQGYRLEDTEFASQAALVNLQRFNYVAFHETLEADTAKMLPFIGLTEPDGPPIPDPLDVLEHNRSNFEAIEEQVPDEETWELLDAQTDLDRLVYRQALEMRHTLRSPYPQ
ncbi:MAG: hypothetical protein AAGB11_10570 [Pseudomonadota bacterium]